MKTDTYLKIVLTIIAINLTLLCLKNFDIVPKAYAVNPDKSTVTLPNYGMIPINNDGSINVTIKSVDPNNIMDVNIEEVGGWSIMGGKLKVAIQDQPIQVEIDD